MGITEITLLEKVLEELSELRKDLNKTNKKNPVWNTNPNKPATENQLIMLSNMGIDTDNIKTMGQVTEAINEYHNQQNQKFSSHSLSDSADTHNKELNDYPDY